MNALDIASSAASLIGIAQLGSLVGNSNNHARALRILFNRSGRTLTRMRDAWGAGWEVQTREHTFDTVIDQAEYQLPGDFDDMVAGTLWDRGTYSLGAGPLSPQDWQQLKSGLVGTANITPFFRMRRNSAGTGRAIVLDPTPTSIETLVYEYISKDWLRSVNGEHLARIVADTDEPLFDHELMVLDLTWRFKQSRGLSYAAELAEFELERDSLFGSDSGIRDITIGRGPKRDLVPNIPETGFGNVS